MRNRSHLLVGLLAAATLLAGCGRVSATQASPLGASTNKKASSVGGSGGTVVTTGGASGPAPTVAMMAAGVGGARGRVVNKTTGQALPGLTIEIQPGGQRVTTGADGSFLAQGLVGGNYTFTAKTAGLVQEMPAGTLVMPNQAADVPLIQMVPGTGSSGITSITYVLEREIGRQGEAPATLLNPIGVITRGADVMVLDLNGSTFVHSGVIRQYDAETATFDGKFGDYSKWLGFPQMKDTVRAITVDSQGRAVVLDDGKLWRFKNDGGKDKVVDLSVDAVDIATDDNGTMYLAGPEGVSKLSIEGESPQLIGEAGDCRAVAAGKGGIWVIAGNKVAKLGPDGRPTMEWGASGADGTAAFGEPTDVAVDPRNGNVVVVDKGSKQVYVYDPMGQLVGKVGDGMYESPIATTVDAAGRIYVVDNAKKKVYKFLPGVTR
jgi:hypothetical protein